MVASEQRRVFLTGAAGFIGFHLARRLLAEGVRVLGLDNLNAHYDPGLKMRRLAELDREPFFDFERGDIGDHEAIARLVASFRPTEIVHLAAHAGVRPSINAPRPYVAANVDGFLGVLEACRAHPVRHLVYASSSSVYGATAVAPFRETEPVDHPVSLYAVTKRANELMADAYAHLFRVPSTGLRFFTVYGPWGRPDMAYWRFTEAIAAGKPVELFNDGRMSRDMTYVDDAVEAVTRLLARPPEAERPHRIVNVGNASPVPLVRFVDIVEAAVGRPAERVNRPMQPGDVPVTSADTTRLRDITGFAPSTPAETGLPLFVDWYRNYRPEPAARA